EFEGATARTAHRRYELMLENTQAVTQEALMKIEARSAEVQALVQSAVNSALGAFQRQTDQHVNAVLSETQERAVSALASLDAESRAACEARRAALETEVARRELGLTCRKSTIPQKKKPTVLSGRLACSSCSCHRTKVIPEGGRLTGSVCALAGARKSPKT